MSRGGALMGKRALITQVTDQKDRYDHVARIMN